MRIGCRHVAEEDVDVGEEVVVGDVVVGVRVGEKASSRVMTLPKNLIASLSYRIARDGVLEDYCPVPRCTPRRGMEKSWSMAQRSRTRRQSHRKCGCCCCGVS